MKFEIDSQTLKDLEIFETTKDGMSILSLFNSTCSLGGKRVLSEFLRNPLTDLDKINERTETIAFFQKHLPNGLALDNDSLGFAEYYFRQSNSPTRRPYWGTSFNRMIMDKLNADAEYYIIKKGVYSIISLLKSIHTFSLLQNDEAYPFPKLLAKKNQKVKDFFSKSQFTKIIKLDKINAFECSQLDYIFRYTHRRDINFFMDLIYEYDAYQSIALAATKYELTFAEMYPPTDTRLEIEDLYHPFVEGAVANSIHFDRSSNLKFVTGPNMAGKSTFLKALGLSVYLAHVGFPIPAKKMSLSLLSGVCTSINISDNLSTGYSHFYSEVMRIKDVAIRLKTNKNMLVIFDELFRGTNVKDAYDGTVAVVEAFTKVKTSMFIVSSHIVEAAEALQKNENIRFLHFEIIEKNQRPFYTYLLKEGISSVRLGMYIIRNEKLIETIEEVTSPLPSVNGERENKEGQE